jgi:hypothetical protein
VRDAARCSCRVHEHIDLSVPLTDETCGLVDHRGVVDWQLDRPVAFPRQVRRDGPRPGGALVVADHHGRSSGGESPRRRCADPATATGDDCDLVHQVVDALATQPQPVHGGPSCKSLTADDSEYYIHLYD